MRRIKYKKGRSVQPNYYEYTGSYKTEPIQLQLFAYNNEGYREWHATQWSQLIEQISNVENTSDVKWLNIHGLHDVSLIKEVVQHFKIDAHLAADILNVSKRSRMEEFEDILFFSVKSILDEPQVNEFKVEQISFLLTKNMLLSFQEKKGDYFTHIRERIRTQAGLVCKKKNDFLLYLMLDAIMENFYITLERTEDRIESLQIEAKAAYHQHILEEIEKTREHLYYLKRSIIPLRDSLFSLKSINDSNEDFTGIEAANQTFFSRLHQKALELIEQVDYDINSLVSASSFYFSAQNHRMNEIMKTLTVVSVVFIPLTFIVGIYGMNFENMPELHYQNGYYFILGFMLLLVLIMLGYFKWKKWF